jgi:hypothetical protein
MKSADMNEVFRRLSASNKSLLDERHVEEEWCHYKEPHSITPWRCWGRAIEGPARLNHPLGGRECMCYWGRAKVGIRG